MVSSRPNCSRATACAAPATKATWQRRIYYRMTGIGAQALGAELERYRYVVTIAQQRNLFAKSVTYVT
jgi:hypothetical protein